VRSVSIGRWCGPAAELPTGVFARLGIDPNADP
jgi:hypothetical protein